MTKKRGTTRKPRAKATARKKSHALAPKPRATEVPHSNRGWTGNDRDQLLGDLPGITLKSEAEVIFHLQRIDPRLADAWRRDVAVHQGPITLRRIMGGSVFSFTHYAYVDQRLLWYLKHDPSDPLGARWDGYLKSKEDAPKGTIAVVVGRNIVVKKVLPQLTEDNR